MCIAFKIHHPHLLKEYSVNQIDADHQYFNDEETKDGINDFVNNSLLSVNNLLVRKLGQRNIKLRLDISGTVIGLLKLHRPDAIASLQKLISHENVQVMEKPFYNSSSDSFSLEEFKEQ